MYINLKEADGLSFSNCDNCRTSCCDGGRFILAPLVLEDFQWVYKKFLIAFAMIDDALRIVMLISNRDKPCIYYQNSRCTIYENRPPACVTYPFTPFYDEVLVDTACEAVGFVGFELKQEEEGVLEQIHPSFYHKRFEDFSSKLKDTEKFLEDLDASFEVVLNVEGIDLMRYVGQKDSDVLKMHHASLEHQQNWV